MLYSVIQKNNYQDSINLMLLTNSINELDGVKQGQVMMATDANKDILKAAGLFTDEVEAAGANDMAIVVESDDQHVLDSVVEEVKRFLSGLSGKKKDSGVSSVDNWKDALEAMPDANLALFSIPGIYAADEIEKALDLGLHVFSFSDNVSLEDEVRLKQKAHEKGLLLMGPDCGTGVLSSVPLAFTNVTNPGNIGIVAASGTGIQEATTIIDRLGGGVVHAIGTGGRDLKEDVQARTMIDAVVALEQHTPTDVILIISKPPAKKVRDHVMKLLQSLSKPVVALFLGEKPEAHVGNVSLAYTLEEAAKIAVDIANGDEVKANYNDPIEFQVDQPLPAGKTVKGLYSGGTLANEAATLISDALGLNNVKGEEGYILNTQGFQVMDLGDDVYTQGKPHPMIDPEVRVNKLKEVLKDQTTGIILVDVVLGYGAHPDMAGALAPSIQKALEEAKETGRQLYVIASVVGTDNDPQNYAQAVQTLKEAGVIVESSNARAVRLALKLMGHELQVADKGRVEYTEAKMDVPEPSEKVLDLLNSVPRVINVGLQSFTESIIQFNGQALHFSWRPKAGGNQKLIRILNKLEKREAEINAANDKVVSRLLESQPFLVDVRPAKEVIPELNTGEKVILHAGPPIKYENMTGPMKGSVIGAMLFEGWAADHEDARRQLENNEVKFIPCHHVGAVGPMGGITSANFPVFIVENKADGTTGYCIMNEGIGEVLRFGANNENVIQRLKWMRDVLGPVLGQALRTFGEGLNLNVIIARAIGMGDEFHQRNIAASLVFLKEITPAIFTLDVEEQDKADVIQFLANTDQFFLNIMMATGKAMVDYARKVKEGCVVTTMSRNGENFGVRISALGDEWFTGPVNTPDGLYFAGYSAELANPDIGDSAITETVGVGGMAMIAAPGVTRFVGLSGLNDAQAISEEMQRISITNNPAWAIPNWNFKGAPLGIDIRKVVETGITPIINTGIAHKEAGVGQIGAGTVRAPLVCFEKALVAYAKSLGIKVEDE
ncbi:acyl-CoA synthetase FdrA [Paenibacillus macerans]|nr:acyl-CoA synthetase FdrA [Paenibacillus macerans]GBK66568.1 acyl-CoA synthetase FdrA [Paenibacillus macerans]